ncbi:MAG: histidinol-phosphate transaminase, partial [Draconibacterium sp.]
PLSNNFELDTETLLNSVNAATKLIFLCSPNNPTGNSLAREKIIKVIENFEGLVVLDEAYIDFVPEKSLLPELKHFNNLVILQTFSKAWGMAGLRLGMAFANAQVIGILNRIKYPYNLNILTQQKALELLENKSLVKKWTTLLLAERKNLTVMLKKLPFVVKIFPSDANFILVKMHDAKGIYEYLKEEGIIVRDRSKVHLCDDSLRITIGTKAENKQLIDALTELIDGKITKIER